MSVSDGSLRVGPWIIGASAILGITLLAGRLSGLLREMQLAAVFGVSSQADGAVLLLTLPDLLVSLILSGGLSAALVPRLRALPETGAQILHRQTLILVLFLFGLFAAILSVAPGLWFTVLAPGLKSENLPPAAAIFFTAIAIPLAAASGVTTAGLNAQQKFLIAGCGTLIFNASVIGSLALGHNLVSNTLVVLGIGIALGSGFRLVSQWFGLPGSWRFGPILGLSRDKQLFMGFATAALSASLMLLVPVIVRALASTVSPGAISSFNYATKMVELPAGVLVTSLATVALARLSQHYGKGDGIAACQVLHDGVRRSLINSIGAGLLMGCFASSIIQIALGRGAMDASAIKRVVELTQILLAGLPFLALSGMAMADLNAREMQGTVLKATLWSLLLLPLLVLPGIGIGSEGLLIFSVVAFQMVHAVLLIWFADHLRDNFSHWLDRRMVINLVAVLIVVLVSVAAKFLMKVFGFANAYTEISICIFGIAFLINFDGKFLRV